MRRVLFTESQIRKILGEDAESYLDLTGGEKEPGNSFGTQVSTKDKDEDGNTYGGPVGDKISDRRCPEFLGAFGRSIQKSINEENSELEKKVKKNGQTIPVGTINYWKSQAKNDGKKLTSYQKHLVGLVDNKRNTIRGFKETKRSMGINNAFQKAGGTKNSGNGKSHTPKGTSITYFN